VNTRLQPTAPFKARCRVIAWKTARCPGNFRYVSNFTTASGIVPFLCHCTTFLYKHLFSDYSNAEITHSTLIFTAVTQSRQEPCYRRDHRAMRSKFRSRLGLCNGTGAPFDEHTQAPLSDIIMIPYIYKFRMAPLNCC